MSNHNPAQDENCSKSEKIDELTEAELCEAAGGATADQTTINDLHHNYEALRLYNQDNV